MKEQYTFGLVQYSGTGHVHQSTLGSDHAQMEPTAAGDQGPEGMGRCLVL